MKNSYHTGKERRLGYLVIQGPLSLDLSLFMYTCIYYGKLAFEMAMRRKATGQQYQTWAELASLGGCIFVWQPARLGTLLGVKRQFGARMRPRKSRQDIYSPTCASQ